MLAVSGASAYPGHATMNLYITQRLASRGSRQEGPSSMNSDLLWIVIAVGTLLLLVIVGFFLFRTWYQVPIG